MTERAKTIGMTAAGFGLGAVLVLLAFKQACLGHGTYTISAVASLPGLVVGMGGEVRGVAFMFGLPLLQWAFLGFCTGRCLFANRPAWSLGIIGTGLAYIGAGWLGQTVLRHGFSQDETDRMVLAGVCAGIFLVIAGLLVWIGIPRKKASGDMPPNREYVNPERRT